MLIFLAITAGVLMGIIFGGFVGTLATFETIDDEMRHLGFVIPRATIKQHLMFWIPNIHRIPGPSIVFAYATLRPSMRTVLVTNMFEIVWHMTNAKCNADILHLEPGAYHTCLQRVLFRVGLDYQPNN